MAMKQFKKWWRENSFDFKKYPYSIATSCFKEHEKNGWRAALECVRDEMLSRCHEPMDIYDLIEEELHED